MVEFEDKKQLTNGKLTADKLKLAAGLSAPDMSKIDLSRFGMDPSRLGVDFKAVCDPKTASALATTIAGLGALTNIAFRGARPPENIMEPIRQGLAPLISAAIQVGKAA